MIPHLHNPVDDGAVGSELVDKDHAAENPASLIRPVGNAVEELVQCRRAKQQAHVAVDELRWHEDGEFLLHRDELM